jgi:AraC-like DNA-binding protein
MIKVLISDDERNVGELMDALSAFGDLGTSLQEIMGDDKDASCKVELKGKNNASINIPTMNLSDPEVMKGLFEKSKKKPKKRRGEISEAINYINKYYKEKITLEELAYNCDFNPNYFCEMFKEETGKNFSKYLMDIRMTHAKMLLRSTRKPVYEIADDVGYQDARFFSQQFRKAVGLKPSQYRELMRVPEKTHSVVTI